MTETTCRYCTNKYNQTNKGEHVFPKGLGGEDVYMDCVCNTCNQWFSTIERELMQKSLIGLMRSVEGLEGYKRGNDKQTPFKAQILLMADETNQYVYEVGQHFPMQVFVRPQVVYYNNGFHIEADSEEGRNVLLRAYNSWKTTPLMITKLPEKTGENFEIAQFTISNNVTSVISTSCKAVKNAIIYVSLPKDHELYPMLTPRIYIDDDGKLRVRAKTIADAIDFMTTLLTATKSKLVLHNYPGTINSQSIVNVGFSFDTFKFEQAIVKIGMNAILHYFKEAKVTTAIDDAIGFVMHGKPLINRRVDSQSQIIDSKPDTHNIFFYQLETAFDIRVSFFNGNIVFAFTIPDLRLLKPGQYNRLLINYKERQNIFEDQNDFFASFR